jgi:hypothetical protein
MSIEVLKREKSGTNEVVITLTAPTKAELNDGVAMKRAIAEGQPYLNRAGFKKYGNYGYIPEGRTEPLSEAEMLLPGAVVKNSGLWAQEFFIAGSP